MSKRSFKEILKALQDGANQAKEKRKDERPMDRKAFLRESFGVFGGVSKRVGTVVLGRVANRIAPELIRPPGAIPEEDFLRTCTRCGACVAACHQDSIINADGKAGLSVHTPYLDPNTHKPCYLCTHPPCIEECPTGALLPTAPRDFRMGTARVLRDTCIAWHEPGEPDETEQSASRQECDACVQRCPYTHEAIFSDGEGRPWVDPDECTGCGLCLQACPTDPISLVIEPPV